MAGGPFVVDSLDRKPEALRQVAGQLRQRLDARVVWVGLVDVGAVIPPRLLRNVEGVQA
jgi:hypothetical protein